MLEERTNVERNDDLSDTELKKKFDEYVAELERRCTALDNGTAKTIPAEDVWKRMEEKIENAKIQSNSASRSRRGA